MVVTPEPQVMLTVEEKLISQAKVDMNIEFQLDHFQIQAILGLINGQNVVVRTPTGSGKSITFHITVIILRKMKNVTNGIGVCLEPLNNILS